MSPPLCQLSYVAFLSKAGNCTEVYTISLQLTNQLRFTFASSSYPRFCIYRHLSQDNVLAAPNLLVVNHPHRCCCDGNEHRMPIPPASLPWLHSPACVSYLITPSSFDELSPLPQLSRCTPDSVRLNWMLRLDGTGLLSVAAVVTVCHQPAPSLAVS